MSKKNCRGTKMKKIGVFIWTKSIFNAYYF